MKPILLALTLLVSHVFAQDAPRGSIRGRVLRTGSSEAIADAEITLHSTRDGDAKALARTTSGNDGRFTLPGLAPGQYRLSIYQDGYFAEAQNATSDNSSIAVTVSRGNEPTDVSASLTRAAVIAGRIIDSSGQLSPRANVQALTVSYQNGSPALKPAATRISNDLGEFRLFWLRPGEYVIQAAPQAAAGSAMVSSLKAFYPNATDVAAATRIVIKPGDELTGIDVSLPSAETKLTSAPVKVSGQVFSTLPGPGMPVPAAATLLLSPHDASDEAAARVVGNSDSNTGGFEIGPLPSGTYDLYARVADPQGSPGRGGGAQAWGRTIIEVRDGDLDNVRLVVHPSVSVNAVVKMARGSAKPTGGISVGLEPAGSSEKLPNYQSVIDRAQVSKADGSLTIPAVAEGSYKVQVRGTPPNFYVADMRQGTSSVFGSDIYVADKTPAPIEVFLGADGATLEGSAGPSAVVVIVPPAPLRRIAMLYKSATADAQGRFVITGIRPGDYTVFASKNLTEGAYQNADFLSKHESFGKPVTLMPSATASVQIALIAD